MLVTKEPGARAQPLVNEAAPTAVFPVMLGPALPWYLLGCQVGSPNLIFLRA